MTGQKFGRLTVLYFHSERGKHVRLWTCRCDCGITKVFIGAQLRDGRTTSCGCYRIEQKRAQFKVQALKHGLSRTYFSQIWEDMTARCYKVEHKSFHHYGGRGIKMCEAIRSTPATLKFILGERPNGMSVDRIDNNGGYWCGKCSECVSQNRPLNIKWSTRKEQSRNTRITRMVTIDGIVKPLLEWAEISGVKPHTIRYRIKCGQLGKELLNPTC